MACLLFNFQLFQPNSLFQLFFLYRDEGIVIAVTIWQWIAELVVSILGGIIFVNHGENRLVDHFMVFLENPPIFKKDKSQELAPI